MKLTSKASLNQMHTFYILLINEFAKFEDQSFVNRKLTWKNTNDSLFASETIDLNCLAALKHCFLSHICLPLVHNSLKIRSR